MMWRKELRWSHFWWVCDWLLVAAVAWGTLAPTPELPEAVSWFNDKVMHFGAFFVLTFWFCGCVEGRVYPVVAVLLCLFGASIEWVQSLMGFGRDADWRDFIADAAGVAMALAFIYAGFGGWMDWIERRVQGTRG